MKEKPYVYLIKQLIPTIFLKQKIPTPWKNKFNILLWEYKHKCAEEFNSSAHLNNDIKEG